MEDRYLFKAKRLDNGEWVQGYLIYSFTGVPIIVTEYDHILCFVTRYEVDPKTICQCTGLKDKNGKLIWENDIVDFLGHKGTINFECGGFGIGYQKNIDWEEIQANIMRVTGCENILYACENDNYISLWEIFWNFNDEDDSVNTVEVIGNIFGQSRVIRKRGIIDEEINSRNNSICN